MNRRGFMKLITWVPIAFVIPKILVIKKPKVMKTIPMMASIGGDGGYLVPDHIAKKIIRKLNGKPYLLGLHSIRS